MKGDLVLLDHLDGRKVAARLQDGVLDDLLVEPVHAQHPPPGTMFRARVDRQIKGQGGVFLSLPDGSAYLRGAKGLAQGDSLLVQVTGYPEPGKATPVTHRLLYKSKYAIVTPDAPGLNVSRSIRDEETRVRLRALAEDADLPDGTGLILRSSTATAEEDAVADDIAEMSALASAMASEMTGPPECLLDGPDPHHLAWREWGEPGSLDTEEGCFERRGVLDLIDALKGIEAPLAQGSIAVEATRALVAVDVNTGGDLSPAAGLKANLAAAKALPRQLRIRGLGGQITMDLAPLAKKDRRQFEQVLRSAFRFDPVDTALVGWTPLGHFELQRKRERLPLTEALR